MKNNLFRLSLLILACFISFGQLYGQEAMTISKDVQATFCGKGPTAPQQDNICTAEELKNCDWKVMASNPEFTVTEFKLTLVPNKEGVIKYTEIDVKGNEIPLQHRRLIMNYTSKFFIEYIKARVGNDESTRMLNPISVRVQEN
jgi:hypothetical protein